MVAPASRIQALWEARVRDRGKGVIPHLGLSCGLAVGHLLVCGDLLAGPVLMCVTAILIICSMDRRSSKRVIHIKCMFNRIAHFDTFLTHLCAQLSLLRR